MIGRSRAGRFVRLWLLIIGGLVTGSYFAVQKVFGKFKLPKVDWTPTTIFIGIAFGTLVIYLVYSTWRGRKSAPPSAPADTQTTVKSGGALKTIFVLVLLGAGGWFILKPVYEQSRARSAERERRKLPVTLACDPTKYNTELLSGRAPNEWVTVYVPPGCEATEIVTIQYGRVLGWDSPTDTNVRIFQPDGTPLVVDKNNSDGWFVDNPTKNYSLPLTTAIQFSNAENTTTKTVRLRLR